MTISKLWNFGCHWFQTRDGIFSENPIFSKGFGPRLRTVLALSIVSILLIASASIPTNIIPSAQAQTEDNNNQPYLVVLPEGGVLNVAEQNSTINAYGRNFCPSEECGAVVLAVVNEFSNIVATNTTVQSDGTFATSFRVNVPFPGQYNITATQIATDDSVLTASVPVTVPLSDLVEEKQPPIEIASVEKTGNTSSQEILSAANAQGISSAASASITEFPPTVDFSGRSVAVDASPTSDAVAIVASESGGLWKTTNSGSTWSHLDGLTPFRMSDVKFAPGNNQIIIATAWADSHLTNSGGIWRSTDGGGTWSKPPTADPTPGTGCPTRFNAWGISFSAGTNDVFVGTDCGVAVSHDLGATWTHVVPDSTSTNYAVYGIYAQQGPAGSIIDTCGSDGHHRSTDGGTTWTSRSAALQGCPRAAVHSIVGSPLESGVLFATTFGPVITCGTNSVTSWSVYESDNGGTTWTQVNPGQCPSRPPWVAAHVSADGNANHLDVYFSGGLRTVRETCADGPLNGTPGLRCPTAAWTQITTGHGNYDQNGLSFGTSDNCAKYLVNDGGVETTSDCGANWNQAGNGAGGFHALQVYEMTGHVHPDHTDLYFGTQDNLLWASGDNGATWPNKVFWEGWFIQVPHASPTDVGQTVTFVSAGPPSNSKSGAHFAAPSGAWNNAPGGMGSPFVIEQGVYVQWGSLAGTPPTFQLYLTTDGGANWSAVSGATTTLNLTDHPFISGPAANPTVYQIVQRPGGNFGLIQITGVRSATATVTNADNGLGSIASWTDGQGSWRSPSVFGVDPSNPQHLMAADATANSMMVSTDGGATWNLDSLLTNLVTGVGQFPFDLPTTLPGIRTQAHTIAFDPSNGNRILIGTEQAGVIASLDGGTTWSVLPGSQMIPAVTSFFFDEVQNDVIASSYGRGLWKLDLSQRPTTIVYTGSLSQDFHDLAQVSATLTDTNSGSPVPSATITFTIGSQSCTGTADISGHAACSILLNQIPGPTTVVASFAGSGLQQPVQTSKAFTITKEETTLSYTGNTVIANNFAAHMSGVLLEDGTAPISGRLVTFTLGTGATAQSCTGTTDATGTASCTISTVSQPLGPGVVAAAFAGDAFYLSSSATAKTLIFAFPERGVFAIGDQKSSTGSSVTFWDSQWSARNPLSGGSAPQSFKGFTSSTSTSPPSCGSTFSYLATGGNSGRPPSSVPSYMGVLVSSKITQTGSIVSGDIAQIVVVTTNPGYGPAPGHSGSGTVIARACP